ncbi:MAG: hypothetical protein KJ847_06115 [Firmicutes bacterium]|nr:hypothetical protein [Bacillota bacterium]
MEYLSKKKIKVYKNEVRIIIENLKIEMGNEWDFHYYLVGSGKRNMVVTSNEGFDLDYHLMLKKYPDGLSAEQIKNEFMSAFNNITPIHLSNSKDSTHVITIKCVENGVLKYSYDFAIMKKNQFSQILKNEKENGSNGPYHFVQVPDSNNFFEKFSQIKGSDMWKNLREIYLEKKEEQHKSKKEERINSFSYLQEATNEVLQNHRKKS